MYALIIAGGEGERLRPLTSDRPKPMIIVAGRPILERQVEWLREAGVTDVVFLCGYKGHVIQDHFGDGSNFGVRAHYSVEKEPLGRGGGLRLGYSLVPPGEQMIIACNGDILCNQPLRELIECHQEKRAVATVMLSPLRSPYGIVGVEEDGRVTQFREKPELPYWINAGVYALSPEFFARLPEKGDHETTTFPELAAQGKLFGFKSRAYWRGVDSLKDLKEAEQELRELGLSSLRSP